MKTLGYYNGTWGPLDEMTVPMNDRASWFGDGVYDAGPARNYRMFAMDEHIDRFFRSAAALEIEVPVTKAELADLLNDLMRKMDTGDLLVYFQVTRGTAPRSVFCGGPANLWVTLVPYEIDQGRTPVKLVSAEDTRFFHCNVKTLNLIPSVMAAEAAKRAGAYETVLYRPGERVTECAHSNVHIIEDGAFVTAPADNLILPGIGRAHLIAACGRLGIPEREALHARPPARGRRGDREQLGHALPARLRTRRGAGGRQGRRARRVPARERGRRAPDRDRVSQRDLTPLTHSSSGRAQKRTIGPVAMTDSG